MVPKQRSKTVSIDVNVKKVGFVSRLVGSRSQNPQDIKLLKNLLSNEKARIIHTLKTKKPKSIYALAKLLDRDFKSVREDTLVLERFGFIEFKKEKTGKRKALMPVLIIDNLKIEINL